MLNLGMGRQDQDAGLRMLLADLPGRLHALGGVGRRHPDVDHHQVGLVAGDQRHQLGAVPGLADDLEAGALEQAGQALAEQDVVLGQDHPQPGRRHRQDYGLACRCEHAAETSKGVSRPDQRGGLTGRMLIASGLLALLSAPPSRSSCPRWPTCAPGTARPPVARGAGGRQPAGAAGRRPRDLRQRGFVITRQEASLRAVAAAQATSRAGQQLERLVGRPRPAGGRRHHPGGDSYIATTRSRW